MAAPAHTLPPPEAMSAERLPSTLSFSLSRTETLASLEHPSSLTSLSSDVFDTHGLSSAQLHETFLSAELFASVVLSRLRKEPLALDARLWALQEHENRLWALKQQALLGSCDTSRGSKAYLSAFDPTSSDADGARRRLSWCSCCFRMMGESKIKLWQSLGDLRPEHAKRSYIHIVTAICPEWRHPLHTDSALLRAWTPDDESDQCALCAEAFTFLNRRHHCRRCLRLVCAVCSPHIAQLRVFSVPLKRQRVCVACFRELQALVPTAAAHATESDDDTRLLASDTSGPSQSAVSTEDDVPPSTMTSSSSPGASTAIHYGTLEFFHGAGFRKSWHAYFFVLLLRKGSLGMFASASAHAEPHARPAAVFKLSGYAVRVKSQKRRPHQFRAAHATKAPLHFAARSIEDMTAWIAHLLRAIAVANELEALAAVRSPRRRPSLALSAVGSVGSGRAESDFVGEEEDEDDGRGDREDEDGGAQ